MVAHGFFQFTLHTDYRAMFLPQYICAQHHTSLTCNTTGRFREGENRQYEDKPEVRPASQQTPS